MREIREAQDESDSDLFIRGQGKGITRKDRVGERGGIKEREKMHMRTPHKPTSTYKTKALHPQL